MPQLLSHVPCNIDRFVEMLLWLEFWAPFFEPEPDLNWGAVLVEYFDLIAARIPPGLGRLSRRPVPVGRSSLRY